MPQKIHWRVYLELADLAKRESKFQDARYFFKIVVST
jgi:tetratricopeptide (TPR) repeat protein